jgi:hypothetical protein
VFDEGSDKFGFLSSLVTRSCGGMAVDLIVIVLPLVIFNGELRSVGFKLKIQNIMSIDETINLSV